MKKKLRRVCVICGTKRLKTRMLEARTHTYNSREFYICKAEFRSGKNIIRTNCISKLKQGDFPHLNIEL